MTIDEIVQVLNAAFPDGTKQFAAALAQLQVFQDAFPTPQEATVALLMLKARMGIEVADGTQRLVQAQADSANAQAQQAIQQAQAQALAAQAAFDALVAQLAG